MMGSTGAHSSLSNPELPPPTSAPPSATDDDPGSSSHVLQEKDADKRSRNGEPGSPYIHLLVLVHGILSSPSDWKYVTTELKRQLSSSFLIYASHANSYAQTLSGIDVAGRRLAVEIQGIVAKYPSLEKISFLGHSLGGLFARYAIAALLDPCEKNHSHGQHRLSPPPRTICGLLPTNFITLATPHLGVRGRKQLPFLLGVPLLEKLAAPLAPVLAGRTGRQLFLMDEKPTKPPLLLRMARDCRDDLPFLSALASFKIRACYANVSYDHMVGWRTSSIRRETELPAPQKKSISGYNHVVGVIYCPAVTNMEKEQVSSFDGLEAKVPLNKEAAQKSPSGKAAADYYHNMEEEMIRGLQQVSWWKVDVSFHAAFWPFLAHNHIHVKSEWLHYEGGGVVSHVADSIKQEKEPIFIMANL